MKKLALILAVVMMFAFAGCTSNENDVANSGNEVKENQEKFLHDGDTYSAELFVDFANTYEGILDGEGQQVYVFDLRSKEEYDNGHIIGSVMLNSLLKMQKALLKEFRLTGMFISSAMKTKQR